MYASPNIEMVSLNIVARLLSLLKSAHNIRWVYVSTSYATNVLFKHHSDLRENQRQGGDSDQLASKTKARYLFIVSAEKALASVGLM